MFLKSRRDKKFLMDVRRDYLALTLVALNSEVASVAEAFVRVQFVHTSSKYTRIGSAVVEKI